MNTKEKAIVLKYLTAELQRAYKEYASAIDALGIHMDHHSRETAAFTRMACRQLEKMIQSVHESV